MRDDFLAIFFTDILTINFFMLRPLMVGKIGHKLINTHYFH